jgi:hypothetical protein
MDPNEAPDTPTTELGADTGIAVATATPDREITPATGPDAAPPEVPAAVADRSAEATGAGRWRGMLARRRRDRAGGLLATPDRPGRTDQPETGGDGLPRRPGRISRPARAGALIGGLVLVAGGFAVSALHGGPHHPRPARPAGNPLAADPNNGFLGMAPSALPTLNPTGGPPPTGPAGPAGGAGSQGSGHHPNANTNPHPNAGTGTGSGSGQGSGQRQATRNAAPATFAATTGPACGATSSASYQRVGSYGDGSNGWLHTGSGCGGQSDALPMSGDANSADPTLYSLWTFNTGPVGRGRCSVSVYITGRDDIRYTGGNPAHYTVSGSGGGSIGGFTVDQPGHLGQWVGAGSYQITGGRLVVKVSNQGVDWTGDTKTHRHVAAGSVSVHCTAD